MPEDSLEFEAFVCRFEYLRAHQRESELFFETLLHRAFAGAV